MRWPLSGELAGRHELQFLHRRVDRRRLLCVFPVHHQQGHLLGIQHGRSVPELPVCLCTCRSCLVFSCLPLSCLSCLPPARPSARHPAWAGQYQNYLSVYVPVGLVLSSLVYLCLVFPVHHQQGHLLGIQHGQVSTVLPVCLFTCLSCLVLSTYLPTHPSAHLASYLSTYLPTSLSVCLSTHPSMYLSTYVSVCVCIHLSYLCISLICLSVFLYLFI